MLLWDANFCCFLHSYFWYFVAFLGLPSQPFAPLGAVIQLSNQGISLLGVTLSVEFAAVLLGLSVFTGASIADVPLGVLSGFVNALALLIFQAQLPQLGINIHFGEAGHDHVMHALTGGQMAVVWPLVLLGLVIIYGLPRITRALPSQLIAIIVITAISMGLSSIFPDLNIPKVEDLGKLPNGLPMFNIPFGDVSNQRVPLNLETFGIVLPTALSISLVGLMETFLTQDILDERTDSNSNKNTEETNSSRN